MRKPIYISIAVLVIIVGCAKRGAPPGGPEDKTPPVVVQTLPLNGAVSIPLDSRVEIVFSERVRLDRSDIFISPPLGDAKFKRMSKGFTIEHKSPLQSKTTYIVSVSSDVKDLHNNTLPGGFQLSFSTGEKLDSLSLSGTVYSDKLQRQKGVAVAMYRYPLHDSLITPDYIAWTDSLGDFSAKYLPDGSFLVIAINRLGEGFVPDFVSGYGISSPCGSDSGVYLLSCGAGITIRVANRDTIFPSVQLVSQKDNHSFRLRFSSEIVAEGSITITAIPSIAGLSCITHGKLRELVFYRESPLDTGDYELSIEGILTPDGKVFSVDSLLLSVKELPDTVPVRIAERSPSKKGEKFSITDTVQVVFTEPVIGGVISVQDSAEKKINGETVQINPYSLGFVISAAVDYDGKARYRVENIAAKSASAIEDTIWQSFIILGRRHYGDVVIHSMSLPGGIVLSLAPTGAPENSIRLQPSDTGYTAVSVMEGRYILYGFVDENGDGKHSAGSIKPLKLGEPLFVYPDTLTIRGRWTTDINW